MKRLCSFNYRSPKLFFLACIPILLNSCSLQRIHEFETSPISEFTLTLKPGEETIIFTSALSTLQSDPVMHLIDLDTGEEVAVDDNGGTGKNARIDYTSPTGGKYKLIIRSKGNGSSGQCSILVDYVLWKTDVPFGGYHLRLGTMSRYESIEVIRSPGGPAEHSVLVLKNRKKIRSNHNGGYSSTYRLPRRVWCQRLVIGKTNPIADNLNHFNDSLRLYVNDGVKIAFININDNDKDGLGNKLESALGTCSQLSGWVEGEDGSDFDCSLIADPRDTDGDGISDGHELLGKKTTNPVVKHLPLPTWGADPRHKDVFLEVDFMRRNEQENIDGNILKMRKSSARHFSSVFADSFEESPFFKLYNATVLRNPDGKPGINAHLDIGEHPELPEDVTIYGDWGGYSDVDAIQDANGNWDGISVHESWKTNMDPFRYGIFRYTMGFPSGGSQCTPGAFACSFNFWDMTNAPHEFGHTLRLGHTGPWGFYNPSDADPNCAPQYRSIMNYAYLGNTDFGFSSRTQAYALNNTDLKEHNAIDPDAKFFPYLSSLFRYHTDPINGHVDWNRDGEFAPITERTKAYANYTTTGGGCEFTRANQNLIIGAISDVSPAVVRIRNAVYVFYKGGIGALKYKSTLTNWNCTVPNDSNCVNASWTNEQDGQLPLSHGVDAVRISTNNDPQVLVVTVGVNGFLWFQRLTRSPNGTESWDNPNLIPGASKADGEPSLIRANNNLAYLVFKAEDQTMRLMKFSNNNGFWEWSPQETVQNSFGIALSLGSNSSPGICMAELSWNPRVQTLYGAFALGTSNRISLWAYNPQNSRWSNTNLLESSPSNNVGRPAMAWVPWRNNENMNGRLYLLYRRQAGSGNTVVRMMKSYIDVVKDANDNIIEKRELVGLNAYFDNIWYFSNGFDLMYDHSGVDDNLRYVGSFPRNNMNQLYFRPNADGIVDLTYYRHNDWLPISRNLCKTVVNPDGVGTNPINCLQN